MKQAKKRFGRGAVASLFCATVLAVSLPALPAAAASTLAGDVNLDGSVNLSDVVAISSIYYRNGHSPLKLEQMPITMQMAFAMSLTWQ